MPLLLKALPAKDRPPLRGFEGHGSFFSTLGTRGPGFSPVGKLSGCCCSEYGNPLGLARLTTFRFVFELLVVKEQLLACGKDKVRSAVDALKHLVLEVHPSPHSPVACAGGKQRLPHARSARRVFTHPLRFTLGFGPPAGHAGSCLRKDAVFMTVAGFYIYGTAGEQNRAVTVRAAARWGFNLVLSGLSCGCVCERALL